MQRLISSVVVIIFKSSVWRIEAFQLCHRNCNVCVLKLVPPSWNTALNMAVGM